MQVLIPECDDAIQLAEREEELRAQERASDEFLAALLAQAEDIKLAAMDE